MANIATRPQVEIEVQEGKICFGPCQKHIWSVEWRLIVFPSSKRIVVWPTPKIYVVCIAFGGRPENQDSSNNISTFLRKHLRYRCSYRWPLWIWLGQRKARCRITCSSGCIFTWAHFLGLFLQGWKLILKNSHCDSWTLPEKKHSKIGLMVSMTSVCTHDVDGAEIPNNHQIMYKTLQIMGYTTGPQLVNSGFRKKLSVRRLECLTPPQRSAT